MFIFFETSMSIILRLIALSIICIPLAAKTDVKLQNIAARGFVSTGDKVLIGGFVLSNAGTTHILIRAKGPSLADAGLTDILNDPLITLLAGTTIIDSNDNWQNYIGASDIPEALKLNHPLESIIYTELEAGAYTVIMSGVNQTSGIGIIEIFEVPYSNESVQSSTQAELLTESNPVFFPSYNTTIGQESVTIAPDIESSKSDQLRLTIISDPQNGSAVLNADHSITYTPNPNVQGPDGFEVEISDQQQTWISHISIDNNLVYTGFISGNIESMRDVEVLLSNQESLIRARPDENGTFKIYALPDGEYTIEVRSTGYRSAPARSLVLGTENLLANTSPLVAQNNTFELVALDSNQFSFHWEEDQSTAGYDYAAAINQPVNIEFLGEPITVMDSSASNQLQHDYNILLVDGETTWTQEHAYRILETMKSIPQQKRDPYTVQTLIPSKWLLSADHVENDISIDHNEDFTNVLISETAFSNATPRLAQIKNRRGIYYSQRLHHALVRIITNNGLDEDAYEKILTERFGVTTRVSNYVELTAYTTAETASRFQKFHAEEIVQLINMFEEMPSGMHILPELRYLVRRLDGTPHPLYIEAPAVAWDSSAYIEFMESAFRTGNAAYLQRLIIHEKSHFLWANQFSQALKDNWIALGGWSPDEDAQDGWSTSLQTEFVSAYAHAKNPNEDMAESISYFVVNPDLLESRALAKHEFIRDFIMQGNTYLSQFRDDLSFQVFNLYPDYVFPGKVKRIDIEVIGEPDENKAITIDIELHALDIELEGATSAYLRVLSEVGTYTDVHFYPIDEQGNPISQGNHSTLLRGTFTLSKYAKSGYWRPTQIVITDAVGNQRFEGTNDFGWQLYIDNPLEDITPPKYIPKTAQLDKSFAIRENQEVQIIHASWQVDEDTGMRNNSPCYASLSDAILQTYRLESYGMYDDDTMTCHVEFIMPNYMPSSFYSLNYIMMFDLAENVQGRYFTDAGLEPTQQVIDEPPQRITLVTNNPDIETPELELNNIQLSAMPSNAVTPNGETIVNVTFRVRDNISGYKIASLYLRDPQGKDHHYWVYNPETSTLFPADDPTMWHTYSRNIVLPVGSAPGTWGLSEITIYDRAGNFKPYNFTEIIHFDVDG